MIPVHRVITLSESVNQAFRWGYTENFRMKNRSLVTDDEKISYRPDEVHIRNFFRFEGDSDPDYSSILYLIETQDGCKGVVVDAYGAYADKAISEFMGQVESIQKQEHTH
jgi:hypothetical protein